MKALSQKHLFFLFLTATLPVFAFFILYFFYSIALLKFAVFGFSLAVAALLIFAYPTLGIYASVFYIYSGIFFYFNIHIAYPIIMIVLVAVLLRLFSGEEVEVPNRLFIWSVAFFSAIALTSVLYAHSTYYAFYSLGKYVKVLILTFLTFHLIKKPVDLERFVLVIFWGGVISVLFGLVNLRLGFTEDATTLGLARVVRFEATHVNPNMLAMILISALPFGFYEVKRKRNVYYRLVSAVGVFLIVLANIATFSRAAIIPLVFIILVTIFREAKSRAVYVGVFGLIILGLLITPSFYWERISSIGEFSAATPGDWSIYMRIAAAKEAWRLFSQHPLTGIGLNNFIVRSGSSVPIPIPSHNSYLEILCGVGIFGFITWMGIHIAAIGDCLKGMRARWDHDIVWIKDLSFYVLVSIFATMIHSMFNSNEFAYFVWLPLTGGLIIGNMLRRSENTGIHDFAFRK